MRKIFLSVAVTVLVSFFVSCPLSDDPEINIIRFALDGTPYELTLGFNATGGLPAAELITPDMKSVYGANEATDVYSDADTWLFIDWSDESGGTFSADVEFGDNTDGIVFSGTISLTLNAWGDVGEYCSGTFAGTVSVDYGSGYDDGTLNDGYFSVKRWPDDTY